GVAYVANWRLAADPGGYGALFDGGVRPLDHLWSLAIEEQFYLVVPLAVTLLGRLRGRSALGVLAAAVGANLVAVVVWWGDADAYLVTPVRAGEILAGAVLVVAARRRRVLTRLAPLAPVAALATLALFVTAAQDDAVVVRGLVPGVGVVWAVLVAGAVAGGPLTRALSWPPLRWLGRRSYAVYLVHWPLIVLTDWSAPVVVVVTGAVAELSGRLLEDPVRAGTLVRRPLRVFAPAMAAVCVVAVGAGALVSSPRLVPDAAAVAAPPAWFTASAPASGTAPVAPVSAGSSPAPTPPAAPGDVGPRAVAPEVAERVRDPDHPDGPPLIGLLGDSTAGFLAEALRARADTDHSAAVVLDGVWGCSPVMREGMSWRTVRSVRDELHFDIACRSAAEDELASREPAPDLVVVVDHGTVLLDHRRPDGTWASLLDADLAADLTASYTALVDAVTARGARVVLTTAPPAAWPEDPSSDPDRAAAYAAIVHALEDPPAVVVVDTAAILASHPDLDRRPDGVHLAPDAVAGLADLLLPRLVELAGAPAEG
ncbi:MAG: acyltransferase, partial [Actinomyces sp.]